MYVSIYDYIPPHSVFTAHVFSNWLLQDASTLWTMVDDAASSLSAFHMIFHMRFACRQRRLGC